MKVPTGIRPLILTTDLISYYRRYYKAEYLKTRWWHFLKEQLILRNEKAHCFVCKEKVRVFVKDGELTSNLLLHHVRYDNLFSEQLGRDVYVLCLPCHERVHFKKFSHEKVKIEEKTLLKRMYFLKYTFPIRNFRLGSTINDLFSYII